VWTIARKLEMLQHLFTKNGTLLVDILRVYLSNRSGSEHQVFCQPNAQNPH
jgi:hypothetical protein